VFTLWTITSISGNEENGKKGGGLGGGGFLGGVGLCVGGLGKTKGTDDVPVYAQLISIPLYI